MHKRSSVIGGLLMILIGVFFLIVEMFPALAVQLNIARQWPLIIVGLGGLFLLSALLGAPPLAVPGSIVTGIGGILYYQNATGNWASWAYVWTLIIGFVGVGTIIFGLLERRDKTMLSSGSRMILISLVLFAVFGAFFNGLGQLGIIGPAAIMLLGLWLLLRGRREK